MAVSPSGASLPTKSRMSKRWIVILVFVLFFVWVVYTGARTQMPKTNTMSGMNQVPAQVSATSAPESMPGMSMPGMSMPGMSMPGMDD